MDAYLLTWKPTEWGYEQLSHYLQRFEDGNKTLRWSAGTSKKIPLGSRVFLTRQGVGPRGIFGSGFTASEAFEAPHYNEELRNQGKTAIFVDVTFDSLYDPRTQIKIGIEELTELHPTIWNAQGSGKKIPFDAAASLSKLWLKRTGITLPLFPDELEDGEAYFEGARQSVTVNRFERDPEARLKCIVKWGTSCAVCGFHFEYFYGALGKGYIHVHHLKPLAEIGKQCQVDPVNDLRPVCPNCHAMLHRKKPALTIEELRALITSYGKTVGG